MSNTTDKTLDRYVYLHIDPRCLLEICQQAGITVHVKLDDEGVVVDAWQSPADAVDEAIASTWKTYAEMGVEVKEIKDE